MPVTTGIDISIIEWNLLLTGLSERGAEVPQPFAAGDDICASSVRSLRDSVEAILGDFVNEDTAEPWTLASILAHLGLGSGGGWTDPDRPRSSLRRNLKQ